MESFSRGDLRFEVSDHGPPGGEVVIALHGFPADRRCWDAVAGGLVAAGYRCLAPDQRGYGAGCLASRRAEYRLDLLAGDVLALADAAGVERFHLLGHDWGAVVAWYLAGAFPERVATLVAVSVPHPGAMLAAAVHGPQALRSWYMLAFQVPGVEHLLGVAGGRYFEAALRRSGLGPQAARRYATRCSDADLARGALAWYRALPWSRSLLPICPVGVPTTLLWGREDRFVTSAAVAASARFAAGPYRLVEVEGSHWLPEEEPERVAAAVLDALASSAG